jgi:hypothetical protein
MYLLWGSCLGTTFVCCNPMSVSNACLHLRGRECYLKLMSSKPSSKGEISNIMHSLQWFYFWMDIYSSSCHQCEWTVHAWSVYKCIASFWKRMLINYKANQPKEENVLIACNVVVLFSTYSVAVDSALHFLYIYNLKTNFYSDGHII